MKAFAWIRAVSLLAGIAMLTGCGGSSSTPALPPDFTLTVSPQSVSVPIGISGGTVQIAVQPQNGFNQSVSVSLQGLPAGAITVPASPFNVNPGTSQTVTVSAERGVSPSISTISVQASSGTLSHSGNLSISVATPAVYTYLAGSGFSPNPSAIAGFTVDPNSGTVTAAQGSPFNLTTEPVTDLVVASESGGTFLYAVTAGTSTATTLLGFHISPTTGALTPIQTITYPSGFGEPRLAVHPSGKFLYAAQVANCVLAYAIDPATGNLTQASCSSQNPNGPFVVAPSGNFAYGGDSNASSVKFFLTAYSVNQTDGTLTSVQAVPTIGTGVGPNSLLYTDNQGHALYNLTTVYPGCGGISVWSIDRATGGLTSLNSSLYTACTPYSMSLDPGSNYAYLAINIYHPYSGVYSAVVDPNTGNLTFVSGPSAIESNPYLAVVEPSLGKFLLVYSGEGSSPSFKPTVFSYSIDPSTGAISRMSVSNASEPVANVVRMVIVAAVN